MIYIFYIYIFQLIQKFLLSLRLCNKTYIKLTLSFRSDWPSNERKCSRTVAVIKHHYNNDVHNIRRIGKGDVVEMIALVGLPGR